MPDVDRLMTLFEAIAKRRAVRAYRPDRIDESTVRELLKEAVKAPTAMHAEPCAFAVIQDRALLKRYSELAKATWSPERDGSRVVAHPVDRIHHGRLGLRGPRFQPPGGEDGAWDSAGRGRRRADHRRGAERGTSADNPDLHRRTKGKT